MTGGSNTPRQRSIGKSVALVVCLGLVGLMALIAFFTSLASNGFASAFGGVLIVASLAALLMGVFTLLVGHFRTAKLAGRKTGAIVTAMGLVALVGGSVLVGGESSTTDTVTTAAATSSVTTSPKATSTPTPSATPSKTPIASPTGTASSTSATANTAAGTAADTAALIAAAKPQTALAVLGTLQVKGRAPKTDYSRDAFGAAWTDTDHNGCDTRNDVLNRDLTAVSWTDTEHCTVKAGALADPYSGRPIAFTRGETTSTAVQIDDVVALSDAWQTGAQYWDTAKRTDFANDSLELLAVDGPLNEQKSDGDAATWLPPNTAYRCDYVARQVAVKAAYELWVTAAERDAMARVLTACPEEAVPTRAAFAALVAAPAPVVAPVPVPVKSAAPAPAPVPAPVFTPAPVQTTVAPAPPPAGSDPAQGGTNVPAGASAICRDGSFSFSKHRQGTCSHHGGVAKWL